MTWIIKQLNTVRLLPEHMSPCLVPGCPVCCSHREKSPRSRRAVYSRSSIAPLREEPWLVQFPFSWHACALTHIFASYFYDFKKQMFVNPLQACYTVLWFSSPSCVSGVLRHSSASERWHTPLFSLVSSSAPAYILPLCAVCISGRSRSDSHHEESGGLGLFSGARRLRGQWPLPAG